MSLKTTISNEDMARLLQRARRHEPAAFDRLYELYADRIYRYVWYRVRDADLAEDLTADIFVQMIQSLPTFQTRTSDTVAGFSGWLYRIAHNYLYHFYRRGERDEKMQRTREETQPKPATLPDLAALAEDHERAASVHQAIARLPADQQAVLIHRFWEELSHAEVATLMGRSEGAVRALQHRALTTLRLLLAPDDSAEVTS